MNSNLLRRLEQVEQAMNPPDIPKPRIVIRFIRPDGTVAGRRIIRPDQENEIIGDV